MYINWTDKNVLEHVCVRGEVSGCHKNRLELTCTGCVMFQVDEPMPIDEPPQLDADAGLSTSVLIH